MPAATEVSGFRSFSHKIETAANIATISVAVLFSVVLAETYLLPASPRRVLPASATNFVTVTLLLVNSNGIMTQTCAGKLARDKQDQILKALARST